MKTIRLTTTQAMIRYLEVQLNEDREPFSDGAWATFATATSRDRGCAACPARQTFST